MAFGKTKIWNFYFLLSQPSIFFVIFSRTRAKKGVIRTCWILLLLFPFSTSAPCFLPSCLPLHLLMQYTEGNYYDLLLLAWEKRQAGGREEGRARLAELTAKVRLTSWRQAGAGWTVFFFFLLLLLVLFQGVHLCVPASERRVPYPPPREKPAEKKKNFREPHIFRR